MKYCEFSLNRFSLQLLLLFWFLCFFGPITAQDQKRLLNKSLKFYHFDTSTGLSNNMVSSIAQDELGFIWIGTNSGLNRFDGKEFDIFHSKNSGLNNNYIQQIVPSESGKLLFATNRGINTYDSYLQTYRQLIPENSYLSDGITGILEYPDSLLIVGDYAYGVHFIRRNQHLQLTYNDTVYNALLNNYRISSLSKSEDSILLAGTYNHGLYQITIDLNEISHIKKIDKIFEGRINTIFRDSKNNQWIGTDEGLKVLTKDKRLITLEAGKGKLSDIAVRSITEDDNGLLWIGTRNGGLNVLDPTSLLTPSHHHTPLRIRHFYPDDDGSSVFNRNILCLFKDRTGNIWIGTEAGVDFVDPGGEAIDLISHKDSDHGLSHNRVQALSGSYNDKIWIGTDGGGINVLNPENGKITAFKEKLHSKLVISLLEDSKKNLWIGSYRQGLGKYDPSTRTLRVYLEEKVSEGSDVRVIFEDLSGNIWVGTNRGGLFLYNPHKDSFQYLEALGRLDIRDIEQIDKDEIWLATYGNGLIRYNYKTEHAEGLHAGNSEFPTNIIYNISFIDSTTLLAGTMNEGLLKVDLDQKKVVTYTTSDGLSDNTITSILNDKSGVLWLGTNKGISFYDTASGRISNLNNFNNIQTSEFNIGATLLTKEGRIFMGGNKGLNSFISRDVSSRQKTSFPTVFKNLELFNKPVAVSDSSQTILDKAIAFKDTLRMQYNQALFSLNFAGLKFPSSDNIEYSYKLEGYSTHWVNIKNAHRINFSQLPPGHYKLRLKTNNSDYLHSEKELYINVIPPFWKTIPAYISYFVLMILIVGFSLRYYTDKIKLKQSLIFEKNQRQLEHELNEERLRFYTGFSHELKTPLAMILAPIENLLGEIRKKEHVTHLRIMEKNARTLLSRINKLLNFRQSEEGLDTLNITKNNLTRYIKKWISMYRPVAEKKGILINEHLIDEKAISYCDLEKIHIVFNNLISNAIKYCSKGDKIDIRLEAVRNGYSLIVKDTGPGIPSHILPHIFDWYYQSSEKVLKEGSGIGLALSKRFVDLHQGTINVSSIPDKETVFNIFLPVGTPVDATPEQIPGWSEFELATSDLLRDNIPMENRVLLKPETERELILLIDDNPDIHQYLSSVLKDTYDLLHAMDGAEGIEVATRHVPDLIISDVMMPEKSGIDLTSVLKTNKETTHIPIILLSAKDTQESIVSGYKEGADDYITKPFSSTILLARIKNLIERKLSLQKNLLRSESGNDHPEPGCKQVKIEKEFLKKFEAIIHEHIQSQGQLVEFVSKEIGMSRASLYRKIKALTGQSINAYIRDVRLTRAVHLIKNEGLTVSQAAFEVGFSNMKYFRKIFKEKYGKLPSDFTLNKDLT